MKNKRNTIYISIWKKTHKTLKTIAKKRNETMSLIVDRAVEGFDKK